jgi:hypothetical protein
VKNIADGNQSFVIGSKCRQNGNEFDILRPQLFSASSVLSCWMESEYGRAAPSVIAPAGAPLSVAFVAVGGGRLGLCEMPGRKLPRSDDQRNLASDCQTLLELGVTHVLSLVEDKELKRYQVGSDRLLFGWSF